MAIGKNGFGMLDRSLGQLSFTVGDTLTFDASKSRDPDGTIVNFMWDFGDGRTETRDTPTIDHIYNDPGTYKVRLKVVDNKGKPATVDRTIVVMPKQAPPSPPTVNLPPLPTFTIRSRLRA